MQDQRWHQAYIQLAFRIEKIFQQHFQFPFVGYYYGPPEWKKQVEEEQIQEPVALLKETIALQDALVNQGFAQHRTTYLGKQLAAIELVCRQLNGERFSLVDELQLLYDITLTWTPDTQFDAALALYDEALPATGSLEERLSNWQYHYAIPEEKQNVVPGLLQQCIEEIRQRSVQLFALPKEEYVLFETEIMPYGFGGVCLYQGNYHSRCNLDITDYMQAQDPFSTVFEDLCHETYPGHHASFASREQHLYRKHGYLEETIWLLHSPNAVIGEGIATHACSMLFTPEELASWLVEHMYPTLGIRPDDTDLRKMQRATDMLNDIYGNAILMISEGFSTHEIQAYMGKYLRHAPFQLWNQPFRHFFVFYEYSGKRLFQPWLEGEDRNQMFQRFLREQWYPSELLKA